MHKDLSEASNAATLQAKKDAWAAARDTHGGNSPEAKAAAKEFAAEHKIACMDVGLTTCI